MIVKNSFYTELELKELGLKSFGKNVLISRKTSFYGAEKISIGSNVRIDDFCILSGNIFIGSYIHISAFCVLYGSEGIEIKDFSGLSPKVIVFSATDDFSGNYLIGPMVPKKLRNVKKGKVIIDKYVQIGAGSIIFPNLIIAEGAAVGAMSLVNKNLEPWVIYAGIPVQFVKPRSKELLNKELELLKEIKLK